MQRNLKVSSNHTVSDNTNTGILKMLYIYSIEYNKQ